MVALGAIRRQLARRKLAIFFTRFHWRGKRGGRKKRAQTKKDTRRGIRKITLGRFQGERLCKVFLHAARVTPFTKSKG